MVYSCYWSPSRSVDLFERFLAGLEVDIRSRLLLRTDLRVARDFNA